MEPNEYGISRSYCFCGDKYMGKDMICCDQCDIWYHRICLDISKKIFTEIIKEQEEFICGRCECKN